MAEGLDESLVADVVNVDDRVAALRAERDRHRVRADRLAVEVAELRRLLDFHDAVAAARPRPPKWLAPPRPRRGHAATPVLILSDLHLDEVVEPAEVQGLNRFDREIAEVRLRRTFDKTCELAKHYLAGVRYDGIVVCMAGDVFSGVIHDLPETNEDTLFGSLLHWSEQLCAGISLLEREFGRVHVPVVVGNHGRLTRKPRTKLRARDNADWLLGHMIRRFFAGSESVTVDVPDSADLRFDVHSTRFLLTHGDQVSGGGGIGGIWPPIKRMVAQKKTQFAADPFDVMLMGHWHQLTWGGDFIVNGSMKGFDEYAMVSRFAPERPQQALFLVTPEHGVTVQMPVISGDRREEGW